MSTARHKALRKMIELPKREIVKEHKHLVKVLRKAHQTKEAGKQEKELKEYEK